MTSEQVQPVEVIVEEVELALPPGDSRTQREAEVVILGAVAQQLGVDLAPKRIYLADRTYVEIDGVSDEPAVLCEVWAHQGAPKSAQRNKVIADAFKISFVGGLQQPRPRLILAFADPAAAQQFLGRSWYAHALKALGIEVIVIAISADLRSRIVEAQARQYR